MCVCRACGVWLLWWLLFAAAALRQRLTGFVGVCSELIALLEEKVSKERVKGLLLIVYRDEVCSLDINSVVGNGPGARRCCGRQNSFGGSLLDES